MASTAPKMDRTIEDLALKVTQEIHVRAFIAATLSMGSIPATLGRRLYRPDVWHLGRYTPPPQSSWTLRYSRPRHDPNKWLFPTTATSLCLAA